MYQKLISNEDLALMPAATCQGEIIIVDNNDNDMAADYLNSCEVIGFDTETRPSFKKGVVYPLALLQLSGGDRTFLFRVDRMKLSNRVVKILRSKSIIKVGVDIKDDIKKLQKIVAFKPENFVDLQSEAVKYGIEEKSLRKISGIVLSKRVSKAQRLSNWSAQTLTSQQVQYAATDAYVSREIYIELLNSNLKMP